MCKVKDSACFRNDGRSSQEVLVTGLMKTTGFLIQQGHQTRVSVVTWKLKILNLLSTNLRA